MTSLRFKTIDAIMKSLERFSFPDLVEYTVRKYVIEHKVDTYDRLWNVIESLSIDMSYFGQLDDEQIVLMCDRLVDELGIADGDE